MNQNILDRAEELGLIIIETTSESSGYPRNLKRAIIGFPDFSEVESFVKENGGEIIELRRKAGQELWSRYGRVFEAYDMRKVYADDPNCEIYLCGDEEDFTNNVKSQIADLEDFDFIKSLVAEKAEIWDEFGTLGEDEFILIENGRLEGVIEQYRMDFEYDSTYYRIGVIADEQI